jgi:cytidylate kinase
METGHARKYIESAVGRYEMAVKHLPKYAAKEPRKLITISRQIGSGGREIAEKLGSELGCTVWGREILDVLASQSGGDYRARMFESLDEKTQGAIDEVVSDFFGQVATHTYHYLLPRAIFTIAQSDAIFLGRGARLILPQAFHVRIAASMETRIHRIMGREKLGREAAEERIRESDHQRETFLKEFAHSINVKKYRNEFDLRINTDRIGVDEAAAIILHGFELFRKSRGQ